mgnify:CR=1 FL=1
MLSLFRTLARDGRGATAIEYALIASLIAVAAVATFRTVGGRLQNTLSNVAQALG